MSDPAAEYAAAATTTAALFDKSSTAKLRLTGPDAPMFLGNLGTNDFKTLPLGGGCETFFCDHRGKALFLAQAYHVRMASGDHAIWLETAPVRGEALLKHLDRYLISEAVELEDVTAEFAHLHLAGPTARAVLESALADTLPELAEFAHLERTFGAHSTCSIRRRDPLGVPGFDVVCRTDRGEGVRRMLTAAGATPAGADTWEVLRVEAGAPVAGIDFDDTRFVMEVGNAARGVSYAKGCFLGQEPIVMSRDRAGHTVRAFVGMKIEGDPPQAGMKVFRDGEEVGAVTSSARSPRFGGIALGYVRWKHREPGTHVLVGETPAEIVALPMKTAS